MEAGTRASSQMLFEVNVNVGTNYQGEATMYIISIKDMVLKDKIKGVRSFKKQLYFMFESELDRCVNCMSPDDDIVLRQFSRLDFLSSDEEIRQKREVVVHRDDNGYGLTVTGDNPVYVQSVRES